MRETSETHVHSKSSIPSELLWGILWRSVIWETVTGAVLGGLYGCAILLVMFIPVVGGGAGVRWAPTIVIVMAISGAIPGWLLTRKGNMRSLFGAVLGALALVGLPGLGLMPFSVLALFVGGIIGGVCGLVMGLIGGLALCVLTGVRHLPLADVVRQRREMVRVGICVVGVLGLAYPPLLLWSGWVSALTGGLVADAVIYAGFPTLILVFSAEWVSTLLAAWYARASGLSPESTVQGRFEQGVESVLAAAFRVASGILPRERRLQPLAASVLIVVLVVPVGVLVYRQIQEQVKDRKEMKESVWMSPFPGRFESSPQEPYVVLRRSKSLEVWNMERRQRVGTVGKSDLTDLTPSPNGRLLAGYADGDGYYDGVPQELRVVGVDDGSEVASLEIGDGAGDYEWSPDGSLLAVATSEAVEVWRVRDGRLLETIEDRGISTGTVGVLDWGSAGRVLAVQVVPNYVKLWDIGTGKLLTILGPGPRQVESVSFSPDGRLIAMGGDSLELWDADRGTRVHELNGHVYVSSLAFSPDGDLLATGGTTGEIRLWRTSDGTLLDTYPGHRPDDDGFDYVSALAFSSGGSRLFSYGDDGLLRAWPVEEDVS
jgi:WD domain, G-beta repeat/Anaphase-promoting complex subunit 4 WD40 domain